MSAAKHTPGPWAIDPELADFDFGAKQADGTRVQLCRYIHAPDGGGGRIAQCFANCLVTTTPELEANARLIAAAPELLEAAQKVEAGWVALCAFLPQSDAVEALEWAEFQALRAAIAKATGGAS